MDRQRESIKTKPPTFAWWMLMMLCAWANVCYLSASEQANKINFYKHCLPVYCGFHWTSVLLGVIYIIVCVGFLSVSFSHSSHLIVLKCYSPPLLVYFVRSNKFSTVERNKGNTKHWLFQYSVMMLRAHAARSIRSITSWKWNTNFPSAHLARAPSLFSVPLFPIYLLKTVNEPKIKFKKKKHTDQKQWEALTENRRKIAQVCKYSIFHMEVPTASSKRNIRYMLYFLLFPLNGVFWCLLLARLSCILMALVIVTTVAVFFCLFLCICKSTCFDYMCIALRAWAWW